MASVGHARVLLAGIDPERLGPFASEFADSGYLATVVAGSLAVDQWLEHLEFDLLTTTHSLFDEHRAEIEPRLRAASCALLVIGDALIDVIDGVASAWLPGDVAPCDVVLAGSVLVQQQSRRPSGHEVRCGRLVLDPRRRSATLDGDPITLTRLEFRLLLVLVEADGAVVSRGDLELAVWGHDPIDSGSRIAAHMRRLRRKLESNGRAPDLLLTVRGEGFRLAAEELDVVDLEASQLPGLVFS